VSQVDANMHETRFEYDQLGHQTKRLLPDGFFETKVYDEQGRLASRTDLMGRKTTFQYDQRDRLKLKTYPDTSTVSFTYTSTGQRLTAVDARGTTSYEYDERDRPIQLTYPDGRRLNYGYDDQGNRTSLTATIGTTTLTTSFAYDDRGQVATVTDPDGRLYTYGYDEDGNPMSLAQPNGVTTTYAHDSLGRLASLTSKRGATTLASYAYTLGPTGSRMRVDEAGGTARVYGYDALYRLTSETVSGSGASDYARSYSYDSVGNRLTQTTTGAGAGSVAYTYDSRDRLLTEAGVTHTWDNNGNLTGRSGDSYGWDFEDRLVRVTKADGTIVDYVYDTDGNKVRTTVTPTGGGQAVVTNFLVDTLGGLSEVVAETDAAGTVGAYYVRADGQLLAVRNGPSDVQYYLSDGLGSVRHLADSNGSLTHSLSYTAFGEVSSQSGQHRQPYRFAGEAFETTTSLSYGRARWMSPSVGRFLSEDPFISNGAMKPWFLRYAYASNDPVNRVDPSGLIDFSLNGQLSAQTVQSIIMTATEAIGTALRVQRGIAYVKNLINFADMGARIVRALVSGSPGGIEAALYAELQNSLPAASLGDIAGSFRALGSVIGPTRWRKIARRIGNYSGVIAEQTVAATAPHWPTWTAWAAANQLRLIFFLPSAPGNFSGHSEIPVGNTDLRLAVSLSGGRIFGLGAGRKREVPYTQALRIDYWENGRFDLHYHVGSGPGQPIP
jgi:RHS repeat-associated protein